MEGGGEIMKVVNRPLKAKKNLCCSCSSTIS